MNLALVAFVIVAMTSCNKTFSTGELKGTWKMTGETTSGEMEEVFVDDTSIDGETINSRTVYTSSLTGESRTQTNTFDGAGGTDALMQSVTQYDKDANSIFETRTYTFKNDSTHIDTLSNVTGLEETIATEITFENDGTFTMKITEFNKSTTTVEFPFVGSETITVDEENTTMNVTGTWAYLGKNKSDELKNNERIGLWYKTGVEDGTSTSKNRTVDTDDADGTDYTTTEVTTTNVISSTLTFKDAAPNQVWKLISKAKDVMEVEFESSIANASRNTSSTNSSDPALNFVTVSERTSSSTGNATYSK